MLFSCVFASDEPVAAVVEAAPMGASYAELPIDRVVPNPRQPRRDFDDAQVKELAESIPAGGAAAIQEQRRLSAEELPFEFMMNALRLNEGFTAALFEARTGLPMSTIEPKLAKLAKRGLIEQVGGHTRPTSLGRAHLNTLVSEFL